PLIPGPYCTGPAISAGKGPLFRVRHWGHCLISASTWVTTFFKDDVDPGAPLKLLTGRLAQVFATGFAWGDGGRLNGLNRAGVTAADTVVLIPLAVGAWVGGGGIVLGGLR
ncbi:hypothetical protein, partial [Thiolapillus sp.]|uniref:hypothetical protein n=1 Tax=Thiolapillus sp. TaxID=2017437 RepID=UPI003AF90ABF